MGKHSQSIFQKASKIPHSSKNFFFLNRGEWSLQEDLEILNFVLVNGFKWARIAKKIGGRTEHCIKNHFFGLISKYSSIPIRQIKQNKIYLNLNLIEETLKSLEVSVRFEMVEELDRKNLSSTQEDQASSDLSISFFDQEMMIVKNERNEEDEFFKDFFQIPDTLPSLSDF